MATIREYFDKFAERVVTAQRTLSVLYPHGEIKVIAQVHYDFDAHVRYLSLFVPECPDDRPLTTKGGLDSITVEHDKCRVCRTPNSVLECKFLSTKMVHFNPRR